MLPAAPPPRVGDGPSSEEELVSSSVECTRNDEELDRSQTSEEKFAGNMGQTKSVEEIEEVSKSLEGLSPTISSSNQGT